MSKAVHEPVYCFTSDINAQQQIFTTQYCSESNMREQLRRYPGALYSVECSIYSVMSLFIVLCVYVLMHRKICW